MFLIIVKALENIESLPTDWLNNLAMWLSQILIANIYNDFKCEQMRKPENK